MQLKQANLVLAVSMAVVGVIVLVSGVLVFMSFKSASETREERDGQFAKFKKTCSQDPFPNQENIDRMTENVDTVSDWCGTLLGGLGKGLEFRRDENGDAKFPKAENESVFASRREQVIGGLREAAPVGLDGAKVVPDGFMFGFENYKDGKTATLEEVPRLMYQLDLIDSIVREMYAAKVLSISRIEREVFEAASGETRVAEDAEEESSSRRGRKRRGRSSSSDEESSSSSAASSADVDAQGNLKDFALPLNRQKFHLEFTAREGSLVDLLNRLASMDRYVAVTGLDLVKTGSDFFAPKEEEKGARSGSGKSRFGKKNETGEAPAPAAAEPASRLARIVTGSRIESPVSVKMDIEVYAAYSIAGAGSEEAAAEDADAEVESNAGSGTEVESAEESAAAEAGDGAAEDAPETQAEPEAEPAAEAADSEPAAETAQEGGN